LINLLIPAVTELASDFLSNRKEKAAAKQKLAVAKIEVQGNQSYPSIHGLYLLGSGGCYHHLLLNLSPFAGMTRVY
jgi:hypothetical protein